MSLYQIAALIILIAFYAAYFIKQIALARQGIVANRLAQGDKPARTRRIETALLITTYANALCQLVSVLFFENSFLLINPAARWAGVCIAAAGAVVFILAVTAMRDSWRAGIDKSQQTKFVTRGIYRVSRNPAFLGFDLLYIGVALAFSNVVQIVLALCAVVLLHVQILEEEKHLPEVFGDEYLRYRKTTGRYLIF